MMCAIATNGRAAFPNCTLAAWQHFLLLEISEMVEAFRFHILLELPWRRRPLLPACLMRATLEQWKGRAHWRVQATDDSHVARACDKHRSKLCSLLPFCLTLLLAIILLADAGGWREARLQRRASGHWQYSSWRPAAPAEGLVLMVHTFVVTPGTSAKNPHSLLLAPAFRADGWTVGQ